MHCNWSSVLRLSLENIVWSYGSFTIISKEEHNSINIVKEDCWSDYYNQLFFKYFQKIFSLKRIFKKAGLIERYKFDWFEKDVQATLLNPDRCGP